MRRLPSNNRFSMRIQRLITQAWEKVKCRFLFRSSLRCSLAGLLYWAGLPLALGGLSRLSAEGSARVWAVQCSAVVSRCSKGRGVRRGRLAAIHFALRFSLGGRLVDVR